MNVNNIELAAQNYLAGVQGGQNIRASQNEQDTREPGLEQTQASQTDSVQISQKARALANSELEESENRFAIEISGIDQPGMEQENKLSAAAEAETVERKGDLLSVGEGVQPTQINHAKQVYQSTGTNTGTEIQGVLGATFA